MHYKLSAAHLFQILLRQETFLASVSRDLLELFNAIEHLHVDLACSWYIAVSKPQRIYYRTENLEEGLDLVPEALPVDGFLDESSFRPDFSFLSLQVIVEGN